MSPVASPSKPLKTIRQVRRECRACGHQFKERHGQLGECSKCRSSDVRDVTVKLQGRRCERCGHEWEPRFADRPIKVCPKCKSAWFDTPRQK